MCVCLFVYLIKILALLCTLSIMCARWDGVYCVDFVCSPSVNFNIQTYTLWQLRWSMSTLFVWKMWIHVLFKWNETKHIIASHRIACTQYKVLNYLCLSVWCTNYVYVWNIHIYKTHSYSWNGSKRFIDQMLLLL